MTARPQLGRFYGIWVPACDVEAHQANGWELADFETAFRRDGFVLMRRPTEQEQQAA